MGYSIELVDKHGDIVQVDRHTEGGTYVAMTMTESRRNPATARITKGVAVVDGTTNAEISITYNYSKYFRETIDNEDGIRWLYGKNAKECVPRLHGAIRELGTVRVGDYWLATPGNAGAALDILLKWAKQHPEAIFRGD